MLIPLRFVAWAIGSMDPAFATKRGLTMAARAPVQTPTTAIVLGTASGGALDTRTTRLPTVGHKVDVVADPVPDLTINVVNSLGVPLSIFYGSNAGGPTPIGNPGSGTLSSSTQVVFPSDWAGRITIGKNYDPKGSKIEASLSPPNYVPDVDVSYVDGYSIPITCSCVGVAVSGCNVPLFHYGNTCTNQGSGPICYNPQEDVAEGPAVDFFAPCQGAAYTYPDDNAANSYGQCPTGVIDCCVGAQCPAPARQPAKRDLSDGAERQYRGGREMGLVEEVRVGG